MPIHCDSSSDECLESLIKQHVREDLRGRTVLYDVSVAPVLDGGGCERGGKRTGLTT